MFLSLLTKKEKLKFLDIAVYMIDIDGVEYSGDQTLVCIANGRWYGGSFNPVPEARPDDGILDVFIVKKVSLLTLARLIGKYAAGKADDYPEYITHLRTDRVEISFNEENVVNLDGEALFAKEVKMQLVPGAMKLVVPRGMRFFQEAAQPAAARS